MRDRHRELGHDLAQPLGHRRDVLDARADEEALAAAAGFAQQGGAHHHGVEREDVAPHRLARGRCGREHAHLDEADRSGLQAARQRGRRHGERVHALAHGAERVLVRLAEALLLVDDDKAGIGEGDAGCGERVRADDDADRAVLQPAHGLARLLAARTADDRADRDSLACEAAAEHLEMLAGEQRGRRDDGYLLAGECDRRRGVQRDLGLAEPDIAADEPVHRLAVREIVEHGADRRVLVARERVGDAAGEAIEPGAGRHDDRRFRRLPRAGAGDERLGGGGDLGLDLPAPLEPGGAGQPVHARRRLARSVAPERSGRLGGNQQAGITGELQREVLACRTGFVEQGEGGELGQAVLGLDHEIADAQLVGEERRGIGAARAARPGGGPGEHAQPGEAEGFGEREGEPGDAAAGKRGRLLPGGERFGLAAEPPERGAGQGARGAEHHGVTRLLPFAGERAEARGAAGFGQGLANAGHSLVAEGDDAAPGEGGGHLCGSEGEPVRGVELLAAIRQAARLVSVLHEGEPIRDVGFGVGRERQRGIGQLREQGFERPLGQQAFGTARHRLARHRERLGGGEQQHPRQLRRAALGCRVELPDGLDAALAEFEPDRGIAAGEEEVGRVAVDGRLARLVHLLLEGVAEGGERRLEPAWLDRHARRERDLALDQTLARRQALQGGGRGGDKQDRRIAAPGQRGERGDAGAGHPPARAGTVIGQRIPGGQG